MVQACGGLPVVYVCWNSSLAVSFNTLAGISSGPDALFGFRAYSCFIVAFSILTIILFLY